MAEHSTDCRSEEGVTVGLIDSLIFICRVLAKRNLAKKAVREALLDLSEDEDVNTVLGIARRTHDAQVF